MFSLVFYFILFYFLAYKINTVLSIETGRAGLSRDTSDLSLSVLFSSKDSSSVSLVSCLQKLCDFSLFPKSANESSLLPQDSSSLEKESVMDEGNMSTPLCFSSWEGKEREIKFNEHFYYVPGALHMLFHFNPQPALQHASGHVHTQRK